MQAFQPWMATSPTQGMLEFRCGTCSGSGDHVMWLVLYVATIASLSALSLLPELASELAPVPVEEKQPAHSDF